MSDQVPGVNGGANAGGEDQPAFNPTIFTSHPFFILSFVVITQYLDGIVPKCYGAFTELGFRWRKLDLCAFRPYQLALDSEGLVNPIKVSPLQSKDLTLSHAGCNCQIVERFQAVANSCDQHLAHLALVENFHFRGRFSWENGETSWIMRYQASFCCVR